MSVEAELADGRVLEFPDGTAPDVIQATVRKVLGASKPAPAQYTPSGERETVNKGELVAGNPATRFALGAASPLVGAAQLQMNMNPLARALGVTGRVNEGVRTLEDMKQRGMAATGDEGIDFMGALGAALNPAGLAAARALPAATTLWDRIKQGMNVGTIAGLTTPVAGENFFTEKNMQAGIGGAVGAASVPVTAAASKLIGGARNVIEPWTPGGTERVAARTANEAVGTRAAQVRAELAAGRQIVPGSAPTAGEAAAPAGSAEFSALQKLVAARNPTAYDARSGAQDAARVAQVRTVGQDEAALTAAEAARKAAADPLYAAARNATTPVDLKPVVARITDLLRRNPGNKELVTELIQLRKGMVTKAGLRTNSEEVASVVDGLKASIANKDNRFIANTLRSLQDEISNAIPGYQAAQKKFAEMSVPVNQMQVGQQLESKLVPAIADFDATPAQRSATYAQALRDAEKTIKEATGRDYGKLTDVLTQQQAEAVESVAHDLARKARYQQLASAGMQAEQRKLGEQFPKAGLQGFLERTVTIMRAIVNRMEGKATARTLDFLAEKMLDPQEMAKIMAAATPLQRRALIDAVVAQGAASASTQNQGQQP